MVGVSDGRGQCAGTTGLGEGAGFSRPSMARGAESGGATHHIAGDGGCGGDPKRRSVRRTAAMPPAGRVARRASRSSGEVWSRPRRRRRSDAAVQNLLASRSLPPAFLNHVLVPICGQAVLPARAFCLTGNFGNMMV